MLPIYVLQWRLFKSLSQNELSIFSGIPQSALSLLEQGRRRDITLSTLERLATALHMDPRDLLGPPPRPLERLSRHQREAIARAVVHGRLPRDSEQTRLVKLLVGLTSEKLRACHAPGARLARGQRWNTQQRWILAREQYGEAFLKNMLQRVDTALMAFVHP